MSFPNGRWHGDEYYFGLHYDLHAKKEDTDLGARCGEAELSAALELMGPDFVQTDCKGHPGFTSWFSRVPDATVSPGVVKDAMEQWRAATRKLGLPLHCHYSGIWDKAAGAKHPEWAVVPAAVKPGDKTSEGQNAGAPKGEKMCPRSPYLEKLLIPQMLELIDNYGVDGFWVDGDLWAVEPCYCGACRSEFTRRTGIVEPPVAFDDPDWPAWWRFTRDSFNEYVTRYCDAVHRHKPGVLVCSNWLQTFREPGEPKVPTDWISGDNSWVWGMDGSRCEARFISTRGKPWDIMLWAFYCSHGMGKPDSPWSEKPPQMLMQEAAILLSFGGNVQLYEHPRGLRNGQFVPWQMRNLGEVGAFVKARRKICQGTETLPQVAVLHSEHHIRSLPTGSNLMWSLDVAPVQGAVFSLAENHVGVDILDEWALLQRLPEFPVVVVPERHKISKAMADALRDYVRGGGRLMVTGADSAETFGDDFLGAHTGKIEENKAYCIPASYGAVPLYSSRWGLLTPTSGKPLGSLLETELTDERVLPHPHAVLNQVGKGAVLYVPANLFRDFQNNRYPLTRAYVGECLRILNPEGFDVSVKAPTCIEAVLRRKNNQLQVHLVNRSSGIPNNPDNGAIDEIPNVGPITVKIRGQKKPPRAVRMAFSEQIPDIRHDPETGMLEIRIPGVFIHDALLVE
ncbi:MAG: alpha-amylase family protein [Victivallales bacterium]